MIFQMKIYYGALLNGQAIYSIVNDGFNPDDFEIGFLTKEQYQNRFCPETERVTVFELKK